MSKKSDVRKLNIVIKEFSPPILDRSVLQEILTAASKKDDPLNASTPIRRRRMPSSVFDAHFLDLAVILLPDPSKVVPSSPKKRQTLQAIVDKFNAKTGVSVKPSTLKRYVDNHPTLRSLLK